MAKIGLKFPVAAVINGYDTVTGEPKYGSGFIIGKAISAEKSIESNDNPLYGDDVIAENDTSFSSGSIKLGVTDFGSNSQESLEIQGKMLGHKVEPLTGGGYRLRRASLNVPPYLGFGFYRPKKHNNIMSYEAIWLYKVQFKVPSESASTKGSSIEWQTPEIEGTIMCVEDFDGGTYEDSAIFETEVAAKSWLQQHAAVDIATADKSTLVELLDEIEELDPETYTSDSWGGLYHVFKETEKAAQKTFMGASEINTLRNALIVQKGKLITR